MGKLILLNTRLFVAGADLTAASNTTECAASGEVKKVTTFGSGGWEENVVGIASASAKASGFWEAGDASLVDNNSWTTLGSRTAAPLTSAPVDGNVGSLAYLTSMLVPTYNCLGAVGDVAPFSLAADSTWPLARGLIAHPSGTARTTTGTGTALQLGAVPAGAQLYVNLHVLSVSATVTPSITVRLETDNAVGFPSPATVATFAAATAISGQSVRAVGPITDDWVRAAWTISGASASFLFAVSVGVA